MEKQLERAAELDFNFNKRIEIPVVHKPAISEEALKKIKFVAFLALGGLTIGTGFGIANGLMDGYRISKESEVRIEEVKAKNEAALKAKTVDIDAKMYAQKAEAEAKQKQMVKQELEDLARANSRAEYDVWVKNKDDVIANYEAQLVIYDKIYNSIIRGVKLGLLGTNDLNVMRGHHQEYKTTIHKYIQYVNKHTSSFTAFHHLDKEGKDFLNEEIIKFQNGALNRRSEFEDYPVEKLASYTYKTDEKKRLAKELRDQIIDDLADIMRNENPTTQIKKLKK